MQCTPDPPPPPPHTHTHTHTHLFPSIEDAKQKAEHDRKMKLAEEKKLSVRREVAALRKAFRRLQQRNEDLPPPLRLDQREFVMDPGMEAELQQRTKEKVELVGREMEWESEKHQIALDKLKRRLDITPMVTHVSGCST